MRGADMTGLLPIPGNAYGQLSVVSVLASSQDGGVAAAAVAEHAGLTKEDASEKLKS